MDLPNDLRSIPLKYSSPCRSCGARLEAGDQAHWSPSAKKVWCIACISGGSSSGEVVSGRAAGRVRNVASSADPDRVRAPGPPAGSSQAAWQQLCTYARRCIEAEAAQSLASYARKDSLWFLHSGEEKLVVGQSDSTPAPEKLADRLNSRRNSRNRSPDRRSVIYGWPTVVVIDRDHRPKVAPLFVVRIDPELDPDGKWKLHAVVEPEFNLAITASGIFDSSLAEEVNDSFDHGLPFGDADAFAALAGRTAGRLGLDTPPLDPRTLAGDVDRKQGVYNAAISVVTEASVYNDSLREELRDLQTRDDWTATAAAPLLLNGCVPEEDKRPPSGPLAAPLQCNQSQEEALERLRRESLTIVTGPPGTGKTQLVVNAVTNSWLDGDKILVASTNNAAVDVAVDRVGKDIGSGVLVRTGNRNAREQVPDLITGSDESGEKTRRRSGRNTRPAETDHHRSHGTDEETGTA